MDFTEKPNDILILGCCYTPETTDDYEGPFFRYDELDQNIVENIKNKDVYIEHELVDEDGNKRPPIGKVVDAYINSEGKLMSFLHITGDPIASSLLPHGLVKDENGRRFFNDLSLGHGVVFNIDNESDKIQIQKKIPEEISIVAEGDRPDTNIVDYWLLPYNTDVNEIKRMIPKLII